jgi:hypothetical protein
MRILGVAVAAAFVVTALVGAAAASANTICKTAEHPCKEANRYANGTKIKAVGEATLTDKFGFNPIVAESIIEGELTNNNVTGEPQPTTQVIGKVTSAVWNVISPEGCTATSVQLPWRVHVNHTTEQNGTMYIGEWEEGKSGQPGAEMGKNCGFASGCIFKVKEAQPGHTGEWGVISVFGSATSTTPARATANVQLKSTNCPIQANWEAEYEFTSPVPMYVS